MNEQYAFKAIAQDHPEPFNKHKVRREIQEANDRFLDALIGIPVRDDRITWH